MKLRLHHENDGVVVEGLFPSFGRKPRWLRIRKFYNESSALLFQNTCTTALTDNQLEMMARQYLGSDRYLYNGIWIKTLRV